MKKMILVTVMMVTMLTGCGIKGETNVNDSIQESISTIGDQTDELVGVCSVEIRDRTHLELMKNDFIDYMEESYVEEGVSEDCKDDIIELVRSIEYDPSLAGGYDVEQLQIDFVNILVNYGELPSLCAGMTLDEVERAGSR